MTMKKTVGTILMAAALATSFALSGCKTGDRESSGDHGSSDHVHKYVCKHHPEVVKSQPGNCPKCSMALTETH